MFGVGPTHGHSPLVAGSGAPLVGDQIGWTPIQPDDPSWIDDGHVAIGRPHQMAGGSFLAHATPIDVTSFPNGPFARGNNDFTLGTFPANGRTLDFERRLVPAPNAIVTVAGVRATVNGVGQVVLEGGSAHLGVGNSGGNTASYGHLTVSPSAGVIVMQHGGITNNDLRSSRTD